MRRAHGLPDTLELADQAVVGPRTRCKL